MGKAYREATGDIGIPTTSPELRVLHQRPGQKKSDGTPLYFTEQHHKSECDVNQIIRKYDKHGIISHVSSIEAVYGDLTGLEFKAAQDQIAGAMSQFEQLPSHLRKYFKNDVANMLSFFEDPNNKAEAVKLGLIRNDWTDDTDGLGEHITDESKRKKINNKKENQDGTPAVE